jgi:hypothetical protein
MSAVIHSGETALARAQSPLAASPLSTPKLLDETLVHKSSDAPADPLDLDDARRIWTDGKEEELRRVCGKLIIRTEELVRASLLLDIESSTDICVSIYDVCWLASSLEFCHTVSILVSAHCTLPSDADRIGNLADPHSLQSNPRHGEYRNA